MHLSKNISGFMKKAGLSLMMLAALQTNMAWANSTSQNTDFTIHPTYYHNSNKSWIIQQINPGNTIEDFLTIENFSSEEQMVTLQIREATNEKNNFSPIESENFQGIGNWIKIATPKYLLKPYEKKKIPFEIQVPENAANREYTAVIYGVSEKTNQQNIKVITRIGVRMYIKVTAANLGQASILTSPGYKTGFFLLLSTIGLMASFGYYLIERKNKKDLSAIAIIVVLFSLNFTPVLAQVMEIEVLGGGYRLRGPNLIQFSNVQASFSSIESTKDIRDLNAQDEELMANDQALDYIAVEDQNGGNPFQVTVNATNFVAGDNSFANTNFYIKNSNGDVDTNDDIIPDNAQTIETGVSLDSSTDSFVDLSTDRVLFRNDEGRAPGAWRIFPVFKITIPAETPPGTYNSTLTFTII